MQTYKFYNKQGNRVAIFGEVKEGKINIIVIPFVKKYIEPQYSTLSSSYNRKVLNKEEIQKHKFFIKKEMVKDYHRILKYYEDFKERPVVHKKFQISGDGQEDFLRWCRSNYGELKTVVFKGCIQEIVKSKKLNQTLLTKVIYSL